MVNSSFYSDGPTNTGTVVAPAAPASFYADPTAAAASAQQAADAATAAAASAATASADAASAAASVSGKANIDSPTFTGVPAAPSPSNGDNSTRLATTAWVQANAVGSSPATATPVMDGTAAIGVSAKYAREDHVHPTDTSRASVAYVNAQIATVAAVSYVDAQDATKAPLASPALTGTPTAPSPANGDSSTKIATTAWVQSNPILTGAVRWDTSTSLSTAQMTQAQQNIGLYRYDIDAALFGFSTSATAAANTTAINNAIAYVFGLGGGTVKIATGTYAVNTILMKAGVTLEGAGRLGTILSDTRADANPTITSWDNTQQLTWARVLRLQVQKHSATGGAVVDLTSWQWGEVGYCWIRGNSANAVEGIRMRGLYNGTVFTTEGTYNDIHHNYIGLVVFGVRVGPNGNSCWIRHNRIQPNANSGMGVYLSQTGALETTVAGYPNQLVIDQNAFEITGGPTSVWAVYADTSARDIVVTNNRVEGTGIGTAMVFASGVTFYAAGNSISDNTGVGIQAAAGSIGTIGKNFFTNVGGAKITGYSTTVTVLDDVAPYFISPLMGRASIVGTTGALRGSAKNLTAVRNSAGNYTFTFATAPPDLNYIILATPIATAAIGFRVSAKLSGSFTVITEVGSTATDVLQLDVIVLPTS